MEKSESNAEEPSSVEKLIFKEPTEEVLTKERLEEYISNHIALKHYIGFEISGFVHLGTGLLTMAKVADLQKAGIDVTLFLADYHSWINNKLGGDLSVIRKVAGGYFKEALKQSLKLVGGDPDKLNFVLGSELYEKKGLEYFETLLKVSMNTSLSRIRRSITIMGRKEGDIIDFAQLIYPAMQVADIFGLGVNLAHGGMDQRKAHIIALEVGEKIGKYKPLALHHHLLIGMHITEDIRQKILKAKREENRELFEEGIIDIKMSKSKPESAIFIHDSPEEIERKLMKAYCPPKEVELNPILELARYILFRGEEREFVVVNAKTQERKVYKTYSELEKDYVEGKIFPADLKSSVSSALIDLLEPARKYFLEGPGKNLLEEMKEIKVSR
ncbi:MAG: tyrosine--tRNA ligase [Candidatus Micrarchaeota archaeon]